MTTDAPCWTYTASVRHPSGVVVTTSVRIPLAEAWDHVTECGELAQMSAGHLMTGVAKSKLDDETEVPF
jgi:hypothetical protein